MSQSLRSVLPSPLKRIAWNWKYRFGYFENAVAPDTTVKYLSSHVGDDARLLDLGCGRGTLLRALRATGWRGHYCGVDISAQAVQKAQATQDAGSSWAISDIEDFTDGRWNAICLIESVYYVRADKVPFLVAQLESMLLPQGFVLLRIHDANKHSEYISALGAHPAFRHLGDCLFRLH